MPLEVIQENIFAQKGILLQFLSFFAVLWVFIRKNNFVNEIETDMQ